MNKIYSRIEWENYPSGATPLNEENLNKMDVAIDSLDDRIVTFNTIKLDTSIGNTLIQNVSFDEKTGIFTFAKYNGSKVTVNTSLEKITTNFKYDYSTQKLILTLIDGTTQEVDLSALLTQYEFLNSSTIQFTIDSSGKVKASVVNGSITGDMLEPNYLANVTLQASKADTSAKNAKESEEKASEYAESAKNSADSAEPVASTATGTNPTIQDSTNAPLIYGKIKGYTLQDGEPTPDNPIHVDGLGDKGYFDGMLLQGAYNPSTGAYGSANLFLCNKNGIPCKEGDVIRIAYEGEADHVRALFYNDDTFVSQTYSNGNLHTDTVPSGVNVVKFNIYNASGITSSTAKHISVTINGKYAIEVKTCGDNFLKPTLTTTTNAGIACTYNGDGTYTLNGTSTDAVFLILDSNVIPKQGKYKLIGCPSGGEYGKYGLWLAEQATYEYGEYGNGKELIFDGETTVKLTIVVWQGITLNNMVFKPMLTTDLNATYNDFKPYTETTAAIPTDAPLYEGDYLEVYADGSGKLVRAMAEVVFDGSDDEEWATVGVVFQSKKRLNASIPIWNNTNKQKSSHFNVGAAYGEGNDCFSINNDNMLAIRYNSVTTLEDFKTWLQSNPVTVVYELAEPTETPLTAEQVAEFKKLYTFEPVTNVLCDGEVEMLYLKNTTSGIAMATVHKQAIELSKEIESKSSGSKYLGRIPVVDDSDEQFPSQITLSSNFLGYDRYTLVFKGKDLLETEANRELLRLTSVVGENVCGKNYITTDQYIDVYAKIANNSLWLMSTNEISNVVSNVFVDVYGAMD